MKTCKIHLDHEDIYYCVSHELACCDVCKMEDHQLCQDVVKITNIECDILFQAIQEKLQKCLEMIAPLPDLVAKNISELERQKVVFKNTITCYKRKVEAHLNKLEANIMREYDEIFQKERSKSEKNKEDLFNTRSDIESCLISLSESNSNGSIVSTYATLRDNFQKFEKEEEYLQSFHTDNEEITLDFTMAKEIMMFGNLASLGTIEVKRRQRNMLKEDGLTEECKDDIESVEDTTPSTSNPISESLKIIFKTKAEIIDLKKLDEENLVMTDRNEGKVLLFCLKKQCFNRIAIM